MARQRAVWPGTPLTCLLNPVDVSEECIRERVSAVAGVSSARVGLVCVQYMGVISGICGHGMPC